MKRKRTPDSILAQVMEVSSEMQAQVVQLQTECTPEALIQLSGLITRLSLLAAEAASSSSLPPPPPSPAIYEREGSPRSPVYAPS